MQATTLVFEEEPMSMPMSILGKREVISKIGEVEGEWNESGGGRATEKSWWKGKSKGEKGQRKRPASLLFKGQEEKR